MGRYRTPHTEPENLFVHIILFGFFVCARAVRGCCLRISIYVCVRQQEEEEMWKNQINLVGIESITVMEHMLRTLYIIPPA